MTVLAIGLILFIGIHVVASVPRLRDFLISDLLRGNLQGYRGLFSLVALVGLIMIIVGYSQAKPESGSDVLLWVKGISYPAMLVALILLASAHMPTHTRRILRHPMLIGVLLWAVVHYLTRSDIASMLMFGSLGLYSIYAFISAEIRKKTLGDGTAALKYDLYSAGVGLVFFVILLFTHEYLFGTSLL